MRFLKANGWRQAKELSSMTEIHVPIFQHGGHEFFICTKDMTAPSANEADKIGWGTGLVEGILCGFTYTGKTVILENCRGQKGTLGKIPVFQINEIKTDVSS